jgi:hypothetical protein
MVRHAVDLDREERSGADMQGQVRLLDPFSGQLVQEGAGEVEAGRGGGDRAGRIRVDRLVTLAVRLGRRASGPFYVRRERKFAVGVRETQDVAVEPDATVAFVVLGHDGGG